jgi:predicted HTH transcriptional regulator
MLPSFPTTLAEDNTFPVMEGCQWEFKENNPDHKKINETICAMLNAKGGYIIIGITDERAVLGLTAKRIDELLCIADNIHQMALILTHDDARISLDSVKAEMLTLANKNIVRITVQPEAGLKYKMKTGEVFVRLAASNYQMTDLRVYPQREVDQIVRDQVNAFREKVALQTRALMDAVKKQEAEAEANVNAMAKQRDFAEGAKAMLQMQNQDLRAGADKLQKENEVLRAVLYESIVRAKVEAEQRLEAQKGGWFAGLLSCW